MARIQQYVWTRYVDHEQPADPIDEVEALRTLEAHHTEHGLTSDAECFYYGILAFERSFAEPARRRELLERALRAFRSYRDLTRDGFVWEPVEDRYQEALEELERVASLAH